MSSTRESAVGKLRIEHALQSMTDAFVLLDRDFRIAYVNRAAERTLGTSATDLTGRSHWDVWPGTVNSEVEYRYRDAIRTGLAQHFQHHYVDSNLDLWTDIHAYPTDQGLAVYFNDITAQKRKQAESQRIERAYKAALSNTPDLVYVFDLNHRFIYANEALLTMWGRTWHDAIGKNCLELGYPDWHAAMHDREIEQVVATKQPIKGEVPFTGTHGRRIYEYIFVPVLGTGGEVESVAGTTRDVTERLKAEEAVRQSEKLAIAGRLAASIAHEINNPLEAVTNLLYLMHTDPTVTGPARAYLDAAQAELTRISHIAAQTLRFYRQNTKPALTDVNEVLDSVAALYNHRLRDAQATLKQKRSKFQPMLLFAGELRQIVANLVGNALDAVAPGGCILLRARHVTDPTCARKGVVITVADTGHGMSSETLKHIFEPFFSTKTATGTGLGLWVTREIVEKHMGRIRVRSRQQEPHRGTVFSVFLPDLAT